MYLRLISFFILFLIPSFYLVHDFIFFLNEITLFSFIFIIILFFYLFILKKEFNSIVSEKESKNSINIYTVFYTFLGGIITYHLNIHFSLGAVIASALTGIIGVTALKKYSIAIYCGSFVGMISGQLTAGWIEVYLTSLVAGFIFDISKDNFKGYGGKLGAIAFSSWILMYHFSDFELLRPILDCKTGVEIIILSFIGVLLTFFLHAYINNDAVLSSSLVSLIGAMIFPVIFPESKEVFALLFMAATFAGMGSKEKLDGIHKILLTSVLVAFLFFYTFSNLGGIGGKLGTIAFVSIIASDGFFKFINNFAFLKNKSL